MRAWTLFFSLCFVTLFVTACDEEEPTRPDTGMPDVDGGRDQPDTGLPPGTDGGPITGCPDLAIEAAVTGLSDPVFLTAPDGDARSFIVELGPGRVQVVRDGSVLGTPFLDVTVARGGDQGLNGLAFHPDYPTDSRVFVSYATSATTMRIASYTVSSDPDVLDDTSETVLLDIPMPEASHTSGHLMFGPDGFLYIGIGDGQADGDAMGLAQSNASLLGSVLRVDVGGTPYDIPTDNPFVGTSGAREEIWLQGFRLPYRFSFDPTGGDFYVGAVGDQRFESVGYLPAGTGGGSNFGWPEIEGDGHCNAPRVGCDPAPYTRPIHEFEHDGGLCAMMGGYVYRGDTLGTCHQGRYFYADYCTGRTFSFRVEGGAVADLSEGPSAPAMVRSWGRDGAGELYLMGMNGTVYQLVTAP